MERPRTSFSFSSSPFVAASRVAEPDHAWVRLRVEGLKLARVLQAQPMEGKPCEGLLGMLLEFCIENRDCISVSCQEPLFYSVISDENQEAKPKRYHERQRGRAKHTRAVWY